MKKLLPNRLIGPEQIEKQKELISEINSLEQAILNDVNKAVCDAVNHKAYNCPDCHGMLYYPVLYLFNNYPCYRCNKPIITGYWGLDGDDNDQYALWEHDSNLPPMVRETMKQQGINLVLAYGKAVQYKYWMQKCPYCQAKQGDFYISEYFYKANVYPELMEPHKANFLYCVECEKTFSLNGAEIGLSSDKCCSCGKTVSYKVKEYCISHKNLFKGKIYCYKCQETIKNLQKQKS